MTWLRAGHLVFMHLPMPALKAGLHAAPVYGVVVRIVSQDAIDWAGLLSATWPLIMRGETAPQLCWDCDGVTGPPWQMRVFPLPVSFSISLSPQCVSSRKDLLSLDHRLAKWSPEGLPVCSRHTTPTLHAWFTDRGHLFCFCFVWVLKTITQLILNKEQQQLSIQKQSTS